MLKSVFWHGKGNVERISERRKSSAKHSNAGASEGLESVNFKRKKERSALRCFFPFLVEVTGFEPTTSTSRTLKYRFFPYSTRLFRAFVSENDAFRCSHSHCFHIVRSRRWSKVWSSRLYRNSCRPSSDQDLPIFCQ